MDSVGSPDRTYGHRWRTQTGRGALRRLGGGPSAIGRVAAPLATGVLAVLLQGLRLTVSSASVILLSVVGGLAAWVVVLAIWSFFRAPGEMEAEARSRSDAHEAEWRERVASLESELQEAREGAAKKLAPHELGKRLSGLRIDLRNLIAIADREPQEDWLPKTIAFFTQCGQIIGDQRSKYLVPYMDTLMSTRGLTWPNDAKAYTMAALRATDRLLKKMLAELEYS